MKSTILFTLFTLVFYSHTSANSAKDSLIAFSFGFHNDYEEPMHIKILNDKGSVVFEHQTNAKTDGAVPQKPFTQRGNYSIQIKHPQKDTIITKKLNIDNTVVSIELNVVFQNTLVSSSNYIYVYKHYENELGLSLAADWNFKKQSAFQSSAIPNFVLTNTQDSIVYGIRYHFSLATSVFKAKLDDVGYPFIMNYKNSKWVPLGCSPPRVFMNLKKGEKSNMQTSLYSICTNSSFDKNNLYKLVVPYGINNTIEEKFATNFFYTEQKIYSVTEEFIFAKPKIKIKP